MKEREVQFSPEALEDLSGMLEWIAGAANVDIALAYTNRLEKFCLSLSVASERGTSRDNIRSGLRTVGFERRVTVAFEVTDDTVTVLRVFRSGRNWEETYVSASPD